MSQAVVYRFLDSQGTLLYVGMTTLGPHRWMFHMVNQSWWPQVASATIEHYLTAEEALAAELHAIKTEKPLHNVIHNVPRTVSVPRRQRPRGAGSVYPRHDGRWIAQISLGYLSYGRRPLRSFGSKDEAEAALVEMLAAPRESWGPVRWAP